MPQIWCLNEIAKMLIIVFRGTIRNWGTMFQITDSTKRPKGINERKVSSRWATRFIDRNCAILWRAQKAPTILHIITRILFLQNMHQTRWIRMVQWQWYCKAFFRFSPDPLRSRGKMKSVNFCSTILSSCILCIQTQSIMEVHQMVWIDLAVSFHSIYWVSNLFTDEYMFILFHFQWFRKVNVLLHTAGWGWQRTWIQE